MRPYGSLLVFMGPFRSLCVLMDFTGSVLACLHVHFWEPDLSSSA